MLEPQGRAWQKGSTMLAAQTLYCKIEKKLRLYGPLLKDQHDRTSTDSVINHPSQSLRKCLLIFWKKSYFQSIPSGNISCTPPFCFFCLLLLLHGVFKAVLYMAERMLQTWACFKLALKKLLVDLMMSVMIQIKYQSIRASQIQKSSAWLWQFQGAFFLGEIFHLDSIPVKQNLGCLRIFILHFITVLSQSKTENYFLPTYSST